MLLEHVKLRTLPQIIHAPEQLFLEQLPLEHNLGPKSHKSQRQCATQHSFEDKDIVILDKENKWFERGVKEAIYVLRENPSLNKGRRVRHKPIKAYDIAIKKIPKRLSSRDNSIPSRSVNRKKTTRSEEASRMRCDTVAIKNSQKTKII